MDHVAVGGEEEALLQRFARPFFDRPGLVALVALVSGCAPVGYVPMVASLASSQQQPAPAALPPPPEDRPYQPSVYPMPKEPVVEPFVPPPGQYGEICEAERKKHETERAALTARKAPFTEHEANEGYYRFNWGVCQHNDREADAKRARGMRDAATAEEDRRKRQRLATLPAQQGEKNRERGLTAEWAIPVLSSQVCRNAEYRAKALAEIKAVRKYSKVGGAIDLGALNDAQMEIRAADEGDVVLRKRIKAFGRAPMACASPDVHNLLACQGQRVLPMTEPSPDNECHEERIQLLLFTDVPG